MAMSARWLVGGIRVLLLLLASGAVAAAFVLGPLSFDPASRGRAQGGAVTRISIRYVCPMHPEVTSEGPGICPICRMELEAAEKAGNGGKSEGRALENLARHDVYDVARVLPVPPDVREWRAPAWMEEGGRISAVFYDDQIEAMGETPEGVFSAANAPDVKIAVRRTAGARVRWDRATSRVQFEVVKGGGVDKAVGWIEVARKEHEALMVPASAVLRSPEGPYVLMAGEGAFEKRPIEIGEIFAKAGLAVVRSGLRADERVVSHAAFFIDAERKMSERTEKREAAR